MARRPIALQGSRREIGLQQGHRISQLRLPPLAGADREFGIECRRLTARLHPPIIDEFEGMREASGLPADPFTSYYFGRTAPLAGGCTSIAVTGHAARHTGTLVGRNYDWDYADQKWCEARLVSPQGELRRIGYTHHWGGLCDLMNESGLTVCIASLPAVGTMRPGVQWHIVVDMVATSCRTAVEAAALMDRVPHVRSMAYLVADHASALLVETSPDGVRVHESDDGILVGTNHRIGAPPAPSNPGHRSVARRNRALDLLAERRGHIGGECLRRVLSDHEGGVCAGDHDRRTDTSPSGSGTIWSMLAVPGRRAFLVAAGHPCRNRFEAVSWDPA